MKPGIHPAMNRVRYPFFTGEARFIDTAGRIDKFNRRYARRQSSGGDQAGRPQ